MIGSWLTVDFDDVRHIPRIQGHPTRSRLTPIGSQTEVSTKYRLAMRGFEKWLQTNEYPVTFFVIADQFESAEFRNWFVSLLEQFGERITVGCHGLSHRCWSAWPENPEQFEAAIVEATRILNLHCGTHVRPWFRAPAGYMAPWMAPVLSKLGYTLDSSINPSRLVQRKAGKGNSWNDVDDAVVESGMVERAWTTRWGLPVNGPALSLFPLSFLAKSAWKKSALPLSINRLGTDLLDSQVEVTTLYWHVLDHARNNGSWNPPLAN